MKPEELPSIHFKKHSPTAKLANEAFISKVIWECLKENDPEGVIEALRTFIDAHHRLKISQSEHMPLSTLYEALSPGANPTLKTLCKLLHGVFHGLQNE